MSLNLIIIIEYIHTKLRLHLADYNMPRIHPLSLQTFQCCWEKT